MRRCIQLAANGLGTTYPNPLVGSVIVYKDKIIGEGWHRKAGSSHAEVEAVNSVAEKSQLQHSTLYVNLEPCSHFGKTPPCADMIIAQQIPKVVIGTRDPHSVVAGKGIEKLRANGVEVIEDVLTEECHELNKRFFTFHKLNRPYIILKWAETMDGYIAPDCRDIASPVWVTNKYSRQLVHKWRTEEQAILVGTKTVLDDNPFLTARLWSGRNPVRVAIDKNGILSKDSHIFDNQAKTIIFTAADAHYPGETEMVKVKADFIPEIINELYHRGIQSVIIEGGSKTLQYFIDAEIWDEARIFKGAGEFGSGTKAPKIEAEIYQKQNILDDQLLILKRR